MNWYITSQNSESLSIKKESLSDRIRFLLVDSKNNEVGKLTVQLFPIDCHFYYLTAFKINAEHRGKGWGSKLLKEALNDPRLQHLPILVKPENYGEHDPQETGNLISMYKHFGFEDYEDKYLIYNKRLLNADRS